MLHKLTFALFLLAASLTTLNGQVGESRKSMSMGTHNAFYLDFKEIDTKTIEKYWEDYAKKEIAKPDNVKRTDEFWIDDAEIKDMSQNTVDVYSLAEEQGDGVRFYVWFDLGGAFLSTSQHADRAQSARRLLNGFNVKVKENLLEEAIKEQEKLVKGLEKDYDGLVKDQEKEEKDIEDYEKKIEDARKNIEQLIRNQQAKKDEIKQQQQALEELQKKLKKL
jgi:hypothetical protein